MYHPFTIKETIQSAWHVIKKNYTSLIIYSVISLLLYQVISFLSTTYFLWDSIYSKIFFILFIMLIQSYLTLSFYKLILTLIDHEYYEFEFRDIVPTFKMAFNFVVVGLILVLIVGAVIVLNHSLKNNPITIWILDKIELIILGYVLIRSIFCLCFIVDDDAWPIESLKQSFNITRNNFFKLVALILIVMSFIAVLLLIINGIITLFTEKDSAVETFAIKIAAVFWFALSFPTVQVMIMTTYKKLVYSHVDVDDDVVETN